MDTSCLLTHGAPISCIHSALRLNGVSTILVMGGSGDYFDVADTVISMDAFVPHDATARAKQIAAQFGTPAAMAGMAEGGNGYGRVAERVPTRVYPQLHGEQLVEGGLCWYVDVHM